MTANNANESVLLCKMSQNTLSPYCSQQSDADLPDSSQLVSLEWLHGWSAWALMHHLEPWATNTAEALLATRDQNNSHWIMSAVLPYMSNLGTSNVVRDFQMSGLPKEKRALKSWDQTHNLHSRMMEVSTRNVYNEASTIIHYQYTLYLYTIFIHYYTLAVQYNGYMTGREYCDVR